MLLKDAHEIVQVALLMPVMHSKAMQIIQNVKTKNICDAITRIARDEVHEHPDDLKEVYGVE